MQTKERKSKTADKAAQNLKILGTLAEGTRVHLPDGRDGIYAGQIDGTSTTIIVCENGTTCAMTLLQKVEVCGNGNPGFNMPDYVGQTYFDENSNIVGILESEGGGYEVYRLPIAEEMGSNPLIHPSGDLQYMAKLLAEHAKEAKWEKRFTPKPADGELPMAGKDAPAEQKSLDGDKVLKKTPPPAVVEAAETWLSKKAQYTTAKNKMDSAKEDLLHAMTREDIMQVTVTDDTGQPLLIVRCDAGEKLKVEKTTEVVGVDA